MSTEDFQDVVIAHLCRIDSRQEQILNALKLTPDKSSHDRLISAAKAVRLEGCRTVTEVGKALGLSRSASYKCPEIRRVVGAARQEAKESRPAGFRTNTGVDAFDGG